VPPKGTRPTADRVREALFNVLAARMDFDGLAVLDLYAGSGALGLEALSRGAASAVFVESDARAAAVIERNVAALGLTGATVLTRRVSAVLTSEPDDPVDLVLADPPYDVAAGEVRDMLLALVDGGWTEASTVVVIERSVGGPELAWPGGWDVWPVRRYGDTRLEIAQKT
jgi:16S rRNA (guanine966-N2)-methyltransferase